MTNTKHHTHREIELLDTLKSLGGAARTTNLAEAMDVSAETIRRTVRALSASKLVKRAHGGVYLADADARDSMFSRLEINPQEKVIIGQLVAKAIPERATVFLDVGSTTSFVAQALKKRTGLTVITNALHLAQDLATHSDNRVFFSGGEISPTENGVFGYETIQFVKKFGIDAAILSVDAIDTVNGFLLANSEEAELANIVTPRARQVIVAADNSKFGKLAPFVACDPTDIDLLVTNQQPAKPHIEILKDWGVELQVTDNNT